MDASTPISANLQRQQDRKRKRKALLAGGVVLGLGAAVTLAAWSDDVFADGTFDTGGSFALVGSTDGTDFEDYDGPDGLDGKSAKLTFNLEATKMLHSQTVYAPLTIKTSGDTLQAGTFSLDTVSADGPYSPLLTYRVFEEASHGLNCRAADADGLADEWTNPTPEALTSIVAGIRSIPVVGPTVSGLLDSVLGPTVQTTRPIIDPTVVTKIDNLGVGASGADPRHLCIAVTMGILPPPPLLSLPGLDVGLGPLVRSVNKATVTGINEQSAATTPPTATATTVTWQFSGEPTSN